METTWIVTLLDDDNNEVTSFKTPTIREMYDTFKKEYPSYAPTSLGLMNRWASARVGPHVKFEYIRKQPLSSAERSRRKYEKFKLMRKELEVLRSRMAELDTKKES